MAYRTDVGGTVEPKKEQPKTDRKDPRQDMIDRDQERSKQKLGQEYFDSATPAEGARTDEHRGDARAAMIERSAAASSKPLGQQYFE